MVPTGIPNRQKASVSTSSPSASLTSGMRGNHTERPSAFSAKTICSGEEAGALARHVGKPEGRAPGYPGCRAGSSAAGGRNSTPVRRCGRMRTYREQPAPSRLRAAAPHPLPLVPPPRRRAGAARRAAARRAPLAVVAEARGALLLASLSRRGRGGRAPPRHGARRCPRHLPRPRDPARGGTPHRAFLAALRRWAGRFTPWVAEEGAEALVLDITGCAHLFGGEAGLAAQVEAEAADFGLTLRLGLADTLGAAWAVARYAGAGSLAPRHAGDAIDQEAPRHPLAGAEAALGARRRRRRPPARPARPAASCRRARPSPISARCRWRRSGSSRPRSRRCSRSASAAIAEVAGAAAGAARPAGRAGGGAPARPGARPRPGAGLAGAAAACLRAAADLSRADRARGGRARRHRPAAAAALRPARRRRPGRPPGAADAGAAPTAGPSCARSASPAPPTGRRRSGRCWR